MRSQLLGHLSFVGVVAVERTHEPLIPEVLHPTLLRGVNLWKHHLPRKKKLSLLHRQSCLIVQPVCLLVYELPRILAVPAVEDHLFQHFPRGYSLGLSDLFEEGLAVRELILSFFLLGRLLVEWIFGRVALAVVTVLSVWIGLKVISNVVPGRSPDVFLARACISICRPLYWRSNRFSLIPVIHENWLRFSF